MTEELVLNHFKNSIMLWGLTIATGNFFCAFNKEKVKELAEGPKQEVLRISRYAQGRSIFLKSMIQQMSPDWLKKALNRPLEPSPFKHGRCLQYDQVHQENICESQCFDCMADAGKKLKSEIG